MCDGSGRVCDGSGQSMHMGEREYIRRGQREGVYVVCVGGVVWEVCVKGEVCGVHCWNSGGDQREQCVVLSM